MKTLNLLFHFLLFNQQVHRGQACLCSLLIAAGKFTVRAPIFRKTSSICYHCSAPPHPPAVRAASTRMTSAAAASSAPGRSSRHAAGPQISRANVRAACSASRHAVSAAVTRLQCDNNVIYPQSPAGRWAHSPSPASSPSHTRGRSTRPAPPGTVTRARPGAPHR